jgi:hypothetical protein
MGSIPNAGPGVNPIYSPTGLFNGYFSWMNAAGYASNTGTIANFNLPLTGLSSIPAGSWNFSNQMYTFTVPTGTYPNLNNQTPSSIDIYPSITYWNGSTGTKIASTTKPVAVGYTDAPYIYSLFTQTSTPILNPATDYLNFNFAATGTFGSNQYIEFWTNGDSIANVITPFAPQSGPTGAPGATGATGSQGPTGASGTPGTNGQGLTGTPNQIAFYGTSGSATGSQYITFDGNYFDINSVDFQIGNTCKLGYNGNNVRIGGNAPLINQYTNSLSVQNVVSATQINAQVDPNNPQQVVSLQNGGGFPSVVFSNGGFSTLIGLQTPSGPLLIGNNGVGVTALGSITATNFIVSSDKNIKENIVDARDTYLNDLLKLRVVNYNLTKDEKKTKQLGFIAQEVEEVFPSVVQDTGSGIKGISQTALIPMLVSAIQSLKKELDDLKRSLVR